MPVRRVFLSYSSADKHFVERLAFDLERVNVGVWYDKWEIRVGDSILEKIAQGVELNDYLAIILSPLSVESEWVKREVNAALMRELEEKKVVFLPVLLEDCKIPTLLKEKKYADFRSSYEDGFEEFLITISPESPLAIRRSKNFRIAQYLLSGLASTDENGTNTLNAAQLPAWTEPGDFVFCNERGKPLDPDNLRHRVLYPAMQRAGIERGERTHGFHIFRHSGASIVHAEKKTLGPGQELLRHTSPVTTQGYTHVERVGEEASEILAREFLTNCGLSVAESWVKPN